MTDYEKRNEQLVNDYNSGTPSTVLSKKYSLSRERVCQILRRKECIRRSRREVPSQVIPKVKNANNKTAYQLGVLVAAHGDTTNIVTIYSTKIQRKRELLRSLLEFLFGKDCNQRSFSIDTASDLWKEIEKFVDNIENADPEVQRNFFRGVWDFLTRVRKNRTKYSIFTLATFTRNKKLILKFKSWLERNLNEKFPVRKNYSGTMSISIAHAKLRRVVRLLNGNDST